jgi:hypothetical protein
MQLDRLKRHGHMQAVGMAVLLGTHMPHQVRSQHNCCLWLASAESALLLPTKGLPPASQAASNTSTHWGLSAPHTPLRGQHQPGGTAELTSMGHAVAHCKSQPCQRHERSVRSSTCVAWDCTASQRRACTHTLARSKRSYKNPAAGWLTMMRWSLSDLQVPNNSGERVSLHAGQRIGAAVLPHQLSTVGTAGPGWCPMWHSVRMQAADGDGRWN